MDREREKHPERCASSLALALARIRMHVATGVYTAIRPQIRYSCPSFFIVPLSVFSSVSVMQLLPVHVKCGDWWVRSIHERHTVASD